MSYLFPTYARWEVQPVKAKGSRLTDQNGDEYLDFTAGIGVTNLGHVPSTVKEEVIDQLNQFWHTSNLFQSKLQEETAKLLAEAESVKTLWEFFWFAENRCKS